MTGRYDFASDNTAPIAPEALDALVHANIGFAPAYGADATSSRSADQVRAFLDADAEVRFVASGTAANAIALTLLCAPFQAVAAHEHAHVCTDEAGAPGFFGQGLGLIALPGAAGRVSPAALAQVLAAHRMSHRQSVAALSLTNATEYGAVYSRAQIAELARLAKDAGCAVHLDGARLANAVAAGFDPKSIAGLGVDVLVLGGAKAGASPAEALVILDKALAPNLDVRLKQAGQLASKGRFHAAPLLGLLESGAFVERAAHANAMARRLAAASPFPVRHPVEANAVFLEIDDVALAGLHARGWFVYRFLDASVRFMCSWATTPDAVDELGEVLQGLH